MKYLLCLFTLFSSGISLAQNPISFPKDTAISKPELNFEVLWHTFEDNYAFFKLRNIDWHTTYKVYRPMVNAGTANDSLYAIFSTMLSPFQDNHINVIVPGVKQFKAVKPSQFAKEFPTDSLRNSFWKMVNYTLDKAHFSAMKYIGPTDNGKPLFAFAVSSKTGYLRFNRCYVDGNADSKPDAAVAGKILDTVFSNFKNLQSLIVDVRDNVGGNDEFAYEVAARFAKRKITGMYKKTRLNGKGYEDFGDAEQWMIEPKGKQPFLKPVAVLTNDKTVSAGDVFAMIMKELPQVSIVGSNTRGIYSDMYGFTLPNSWMISLSNQRYYNNKMECYEGAGTPVNIKVLNTRQDLIKMNDPVLKTAFKKLSR
ncbi:MAG: Peptidase family [Ferruginibacter sp.]|uniref:S41 family peptidase n=1 Tax=Ferruginibacter sp. TaxID=1940288 RepID=UPI002657C9D3|nr:S41 family peptidase [Ferruginibacter sp.]MDB5278241.1 Peptidase family [Ferruginibacter sp.]